MMESKTISNILKWLPLSIVIIGVIGSYITLQNQQVGAVDRLNKIENKQISVDVTNTQILVQLSAIQSDLGWIRERLKSIK